MDRMALNTGLQVSLSTADVDVDALLELEAPQPSNGDSTLAAEVEHCNVDAAADHRC